MPARLPNMSFDPVMPPYNASDPAARFLSSSCLDFLLIELVPMSYRVANELEAVAREQEAAAAAGSYSGTTAIGDGLSNGDGGAGADGVSSLGKAGAGSLLAGQGQGTGTVMDEEEEREAVFCRLEAIGYRVGQGLVERYVSPVMVLPRALPCLIQQQGEAEREWY